MAHSYILVSKKQRHDVLYQRLASSLQGQWHLITDKTQLSLEKLTAINPKYIFIPHWSDKIADEITERFACIMFHMTDLPYGRGGSPLQNLIVRGHEDTQLSAFRCNEQLDAGPIYGKLLLSLAGTATEIFNRADLLVGQLIFDIIQHDIEPIPQVGQVTTFTRRLAEQSNITNLDKLSDVYDYIRMLDADGYPNAFLNSGEFILTFTDAVHDEEQVSAQVIFKRNAKQKNETGILQ